MHSLIRSFPAVFLVLFGVLSTPANAHASCAAFLPYDPLPNAPNDLYSEAAQIVVSRDGSKTVTTMQNNYTGPVEDFGAVVAVPQALNRKDIRVLPRNALEPIGTITGPMLRETWPARFQHEAKSSAMAGESGPGVSVVDSFDVAEYEITVLKANEATELADWLVEHGLQLSPEAPSRFQPYIANGSYFFVARVHVERVEFEGDKAKLSPLQFRYDSDEFILPIRLGMLNNPGRQDLIIYVLGDSRYDVANRPNATIPTGLDVDPRHRLQMDRYYESLFRETIEDDPNTVVTEYAWDAFGRCYTGMRFHPGPHLDLHALTWSNNVLGVGFLFHPSSELREQLENRRDRFRKAVVGCVSEKDGQPTSKRLTLKSLEGTTLVFPESERKTCEAQVILDTYADLNFETPHTFEIHYFRQSLPRAKTEGLVVTRLRTRPTKDTKSDLLLRRAKPLSTRDWCSGNAFSADYFIEHSEPISDYARENDSVIPVAGPIKPLPSTCGGCASTRTTILPVLLLLLGRLRRD